MIRDWISEWLEKRTPQLLRISILSLPSARGESVRVRYVLSEAAHDTAVFFDPASGTRADVDGGSIASVVRAEGFWQIRFADDVKSRFVDFVCQWPLTSDAFRVWADVPTVGLRKVGTRGIPELEMPKVESEQCSAYVATASSQAPLVAATITRGVAAAGALRFSPDQPPTLVRSSDSFSSRPLIEAYEAIARSLDRAVHARVVQLVRVGLAQADFASVGVTHRVPSSLMNEANASTLALRWEVSSLWWGGTVQPLDSGADQLVHALRIATAICSGPPDDGAETAFFRYLETGSSEQWERWIGPCLSDAKELLSSHRSDVVSRLSGLYREFESRRVSESSLRRKLRLG